MRIFYISYWSSSEQLVNATILPQIEILKQLRPNARITLFTVERTSDFELLEGDNFEHVPIDCYSSNKWKMYFNTIHHARSSLHFAAKQTEPDLIIARGATAGALAYWLKGKINKPVVVESFEPHAKYMLHAGVWGRTDPRYLLQRQYEKQQLNHVDYLVTVSKFYQEFIASKTEAKTFTVPCYVDAVKFKFQKAARLQIRKELDIEEAATVGVYVGKLGGIYHDKAFVELLLQLPKGYQFVICTGQPQEYFNSLIADVEQSETSELLNRTTILKAPHDSIPAYLSAADFGLCPVRPTPTSKACSAVKLGEYYANGLPTLITPDIGDDSDLIEKTKAGWVTDENFQLSEEPQVRMKLELKAWDRSNNSALKLATEIRNKQTAVDVYSDILENTGL